MTDTMRAARFTAATRRSCSRRRPPAWAGSAAASWSGCRSTTWRSARASSSASSRRLGHLGHLGYEKRHLDELVTLVELGRLDVSGSVSDVLPLEEVGRGVERLTSEQGDPIRLVVQPWT